MAAELCLKVVIAVLLGAATTQGKICANIVFGFDTSCSISDDVKDANKQFMIEIVRLFDSIAAPNGKRSSQFGLLAFDRDGHKVLGFGDANTQQEVIKNITEFDYTAVDCKTIISAGIDMAIEDFFDSGDQDDKSPNVLILLTDARTQPQKFIENTTASINRLRAIPNTYVFLVQSPNKNDKTEFEDTIEQVNRLADQDNIFQYSNDSKDLAKTVYDRFDEISRDLQCPGAKGGSDINGTFPCDQNDPLDVLLILDHSNSIKPENIIRVRDAMGKLVSEFDNVGDGDNSVKFALLTYNDRVIPEMLFNDTASSTREGTLAAIVNESMTRRKNTRTDLALEFANNVVFTPEAGDRDFAFNVLILVTDGRTMKARYQKHTIRTAHAIKARTGTKEVAIFLLGLPGARAKNLKIQQQEWNEIPTAPKSTHFQDFDHFDDLLLFIKELSLRVCASGR